MNQKGGMHNFWEWQLTAAIHGKSVGVRLILMAEINCSINRQRIYSSPSLLKRFIPSLNH